MNTNNIWIAVGDETGKFNENNPDAKNFHGAAMILARQKDLQEALQEKPFSDGKTISERLSNRIDGLDENTKNKHHVKDVWEYLKKHNITGKYDLDNISNSPEFTPLYTLGETFKWLIQQKNLISIGIYSKKAADIMQNFTNSNDAAYILGSLYGKMLGLIAPFLGDNATIIAFPGLRSESVNSPSIKNSGQKIDSKYIITSELGEQRAGGNITGGNRVSENGVKTAFDDTIKAFNKLNVKTKCNAKILVRRLLNDGYIFDEEVQELTETVKFVTAKDNAMPLSALADLVCSLMLCAYNDKANTTIKIPKPIGNNIHFWNINDINDINDITNN